VVLTGETLHPGEAAGELLVLGEPLSFWGGTDASGRVIEPHHPQHGALLAGRVVAMPSGRGSSSSSSVLAEQVRAGAAPAALLLASPDAILVLAAIVAAELYGRLLPIVLLEPGASAALCDGARVGVRADDGGATIERRRG
jgi:uncharacterized protein